MTDAIESDLRKHEIEQVRVELAAEKRERRIEAEIKRLLLTSGGMEELLQEMSDYSLACYLANLLRQIDTGDYLSVRVAAELTAEHLMLLAARLAEATED